MSITPIGATSVSALTLSRLLGKQDSTSTTDDLLSLLASDQDTLSISSEGQWLSRSQGDNPFKRDFDNLGDLIASGDLSGAQKAFEAMQARMQTRQGTEDPMASSFSAIGDALQSGDLASAQSAWSSMQNSLASMASGSSTNPMQRDLDQLGSLLASGDTSSASSLLEKLLERFQASGASASGSGTEGSTTLSAKFEALASALDSGDTEAASTALSELEEALKKNPPPPPPGRRPETETTSLDALLLSNYWNLSNLDSMFSSGSSQG